MPLHDVNFEVNITQATLSVDFATHFTVILTTTYIFRISTFFKSICDKTTAKKY